MNQLWGWDGSSGLQILSFGVDEVQELLPRLLVLPKRAQHGRSNRLAVDFLHTSHHHAHVSVGVVMKDIL